MGCITSKAITRSMSIREELRQGFHSRSAAWEELLTSHSHGGNDGQLLAFVCPSNLKTTSFTLPSSTDPSTNTTNAETASDIAQFTRSKSCNTLRERDLLMPALKDGKRSLSFHTVEEYDALLLERIRLEEEEEDDVKMQQPTCLAEEDEEESCNASVETGWKRKAVARGLKSLDVSPVELPAVARLRERMVEQGQIYSPGTYVTPKFGSYNAPSAITMPQNETKKDAVFSPELLAAFEDCMQQLQVEEDTILRHMDPANSSNMYNPIDLQS